MMSFNPEVIQHNRIVVNGHALPSGTVRIELMPEIHGFRAMEFSKLHLNFGTEKFLSELPERFLISIDGHEFSAEKRSSSVETLMVVLKVT